MNSIYLKFKCPYETHYAADILCKLRIPKPTGHTHDCMVLSIGTLRRFWEKDE